MRSLSLFTKSGLFLIGAIFILRPAAATCTYSNSQTAHFYTIPVSALNPSRDVAIGTVLYKQTAQLIPTGGVTYANCSSPGQASRVVTGAALLSSTGGVYTYATNIDGIGVRYFDSASNGSSVRYWGAGNGESWGGTWAYNSSVLVGVEIVRVASTGHGISAGRVNPDTAATYTLDGLLISTVQFAPFDVGATTCSVSTPAVNVKMPRINVSQLPSVDSTAGNTDFSIGLNCPSGVKVAMTINDASNPGNRSTTMFFGPDSTASGIGYQIVNNGSAIGYGPDSSEAGTMNQFIIIPAAVAGVYNVVMTAQYIRTGKIVPGSANAYATFTLSYQ